MFQFIRSSSFTAQAMVPVLGGLLFAAGWFLPGSLISTSEYGGGFYFIPADGWFYSQWTLLAKLPLWAQIAPTALLAILTAWWLIRLDMQNLLLGRRSYGAGYVFLFLIVSQGHLFLFHPAYLSGFLMLIGTGYLISLFKQETVYELVFGFSFTWGTAVLIYPPAAVTIPVIIIGLAVMVTATWRHWAVSLMGLTLPALVCSAIFYLTGDLDYQVTSFLSWFRIRTTWIPPFLSKEILIAAWFGILVLWFVIASIGYRNPKVLSRQLFLVNSIHFLLALGMMVLLETVSVEAFWLMLIPLTYYYTFWASEVRRNWVRDLFFLTLTGSFVFFRIRGLI